MNKGRIVLGFCLAAFGGAVSLEAQERIVVITEPGTPVIASEILLAVGPADEDSLHAGLAYLSGRAILARALPALDSIGASTELVPQKDALSFSVTAAPDVWQEATRILLEALFRDAPDSVTIVRQRSAIADELRGRLANPADAATRELDQAFFGAGHPWGRPTVGTPESVEKLTYSEVTTFLKENFTPERGYVAVVGPVEESDAREHLRPLLGRGVRTPVELIPFRSAVSPVRRDYNSVTSWVSASYRFPETADEETMRFLAYLASSALSFSPARRSVYDVRSEVVTRVGGGEIRLQMVVPPEEANDWAKRIEESISQLATASMLEDEFEAHVRRFRGERVMRLISPEERAENAARQLLVKGRLLGIPDPEAISPEKVRAAARALGRPTIVILGPRTTTTN